MQEWNSIIYKEFNPDLLHLKTSEQTEKHWNENGKKENRFSQITDLYPTFNWNEYQILNPYLFLIGLRSQKDYEIHYAKEGRYKGLIYNDSMKNNKYSFHLLLPTIGKSSIFRILEKLKLQLEPIDYLTIIYDGEKNATNIEDVKNYTKDFLCKVNVIVQKDNLGYWGHSIRNKYVELDGDFVFHIDDDDIIMDNTMPLIRKICIDKNFIYIFRMILENGDIIWKSKNIIKNEISTQSGIIPIHINKESYWQLKYGGDYDYYNQLYKKYKSHFLFIDNIIYQKF